MTASPTYSSAYSSTTNIYSTSIMLCALYVMMALGLMKMAQRAGIAHYWLAWIPLANIALLIQLAGIRKLGVGIAFVAALLAGIGCDIALFGYAMPASAIVPVSPLLIVPAVLCPFTAYILYIILLNSLFRRFRPRNSTSFTVLSAIFWFLGPIFILVAGFTHTPVDGPKAPPAAPRSMQGPPTFTPPSGI